MCWPHGVGINRFLRNGKGWRGWTELLRSTVRGLCRRLQQLSGMCDRLCRLLRSDGARKIVLRRKDGVLHNARRDRMSARL